MLYRELETRNGQVRVTFAWPARFWVDQLSLVGDFNGWDASTHPLEVQKNESERSVTLSLPVGRTYRFAYVADGARCLEPNADGFVRDAEGGLASLLITQPGSSGSGFDRRAVQLENNIPH
jgi:1,4-alpha-glucan branching enzyme